MNEKKSLPHRNAGLSQFQLKRGRNLGFSSQIKTTDFPYVYTYFVILSEAKSPFVKSDSRINADPSLRSG